LNAAAFGININSLNQCCAAGLNASVPNPGLSTSCRCQDLTGGGQTSPFINNDHQTNPDSNYAPPTPTPTPTLPPPADPYNDVRTCPDVPCPSSGGTFTEAWYNTVSQIVPTAFSVCPQGTYPRIVSAQANQTTAAHDPTNTMFQCVNNRPNGSPCGSSDGQLGLSFISAPDYFDGSVNYPSYYQLLAYKTTGFSTLRFGCGVGSFCNMSSSIQNPNNQQNGVCTGFYQNIPRAQIATSDPFSLNRLTCGSFSDCPNGKQCLNGVCLFVFDRYGPCRTNQGQGQTDSDYSCPQDQYCGLNPKNSIYQCMDSTPSGKSCKSDDECSTGLCLSTTVPIDPSNQIQTCQDPDWSFIGRSCNTNQLNPNSLSNGFKVMDATNNITAPPTTPPALLNSNCGELGTCVCTLGSNNNHGVCIPKRAKYNTWLVKNGKPQQTDVDYQRQVESVRQVQCFSVFSTKAYLESSSFTLSSSLTQTLVLALAAFVAMFKF